MRANVSVLKPCDEHTGLAHRRAFSTPAPELIASGYAAASPAGRRPRGCWFARFKRAFRDGTSHALVSLQRYLSGRPSRSAESVGHLRWEAEEHPNGVRQEVYSFKPRTPRLGASDGAFDGSLLTRDRRVWPRARRGRG